MYVELQFDLVREHNDQRIGVANEKSYGNLGPNNLCSENKLSNTSGKELESNQHANTKCLMQKIMMSSSGPRDLSFSVAREVEDSENECLNIKVDEGKLCQKPHYK